MNLADAPDDERNLRVEVLLRVEAEKILWGDSTPISNLARLHRLVPRIDSIGFADEISR